MFDTVKLLRNAIKSKFTFNDWAIAFNGEDSWSFGNDFARNIVNFGVDDSPLSHTDDRENNYLVLGEGLTDGINDGTSSAEKKLVFSIEFSKANTNFCLSLHYNGDESYLHVNKQRFTSLRWIVIEVGIVFI